MYIYFSLSPFILNHHDSIHLCSSTDFGWCQLLLPAHCLDIRQPNPIPFRLFLWLSALLPLSCQYNLDINSFPSLNLLSRQSPFSINYQKFSISSFCGRVCAPNYVTYPQFSSIFLLFSPSCVRRIHPRFLLVLLQKMALKSSKQHGVVYTSGTPNGCTSPQFLCFQAHTPSKAQKVFYFHPLPSRYPSTSNRPNFRQKSSLDSKPETRICF